MIGFLIKHRIRPSLTGGAWIKTWLKRLVSFPEVWCYGFEIYKWQLRGASIETGAVIARLKLQGKAANVHIGRFCSLGRIAIQAHGPVHIGKCVVINDDVRLITGSHDVNSPCYDHKFLPISIDDYAWIATGAMILQGVKIGRGAVVAAGAVVAKDVLPYEIVAGNPARKISVRKQANFQYIPSTWFAPIMAWTGRNPKGLIS